MRKSLPVIQCCTPLSGPPMADGQAVALEQLFKVLADRHRVKILNILLRAGGQAVCVCEFQDQLGLAQPTVSYHLKQLTEAGLLLREKRGTFAYFRLAPGALETVQALLVPAALAEAS
ncbi:MAG: ArsR family transcriptional regulator, arsenate/arsenite/antimonite-responsive transcriptional [Gaiellales bacterium]|jgi:ArsR family transcriptional regulator|nr:ArsR family transcriptional regulator, arsenate/arsenite/antimonite-responsive transcriptional [Gaiellales bacterium]